MAASARWWPIAATVLALVAINVTTNRLLPAEAYVPFALACAAGLVAFAHRVDGCGWDELGLDPANVGRGLRWGGAVVAAVALGYLVVAAVPATRDVLLDDRVEDLSLAGAAWAALVRVPLGTVVLEEVAFRGVLVAQLRRWTSVAVAVATSAVLFGLWHVLPALGVSNVNPVADDAVGDLPTVVTVGASVAFTAVAGVWFWWLRDRSRSLVAPMLAHWSTNGLGYLFAWWAWNR